MRSRGLLAPIALLTLAACGANRGADNIEENAPPAPSSEGATSAAPSAASQSTHHPELLAEIPLSNGDTVRYYHDDGALMVSEVGPPEARPLPGLSKIRPTDLYTAVMRAEPPPALSELQDRIEQADALTGTIRWRARDAADILGAVHTFPGPAPRELWDASVCQWVTDDYNFNQMWGQEGFTLWVQSWHWGPWADGLYFNSPNYETLDGAEVCAITGPFDYTVNSTHVTLKGPGWWWRYYIETASCSWKTDVSLSAEVTNAIGQVFNFYAFDAATCVFAD
jgi:hypothetical protein